MNYCISNCYETTTIVNITVFVIVNVAVKFFYGVVHAAYPGAHPRR